MLRITDVVPHPQMRKQRVILKQISNRPLLRRNTCPVDSIEYDSSGSEPIETRDTTEDCCFPGTRRAEQNRNGRGIRNTDRRFDARSEFKLPDDVGDQQQKTTPFGSVHKRWKE